MNCIYAFVAGLVIGFIIGLLIYRNNVKTANALAAKTQDDLNAANAALAAAKKVI